MRTYGLIGYPLEHSFSKNYFTKKFEAEGLSDASFELFPIEDINVFPDVLYNNSTLRGLAVTIPYKQQVIKYIDELDPVAAEIDAVNCIQFKHGKLIGHNTDAVGFEKSLHPLLKPNHKKALILGTGGASKSVMHVLKKLGIEFVNVSRHEVMGNITYGELNEDYIRNHHLIVNCSPLGMYPNIDTYPSIPYEYLSEDHLLYDLVYNPEKTLFLELGKDRGAVVKNGYEMLVLQGEENWRIWNS